MRPKNDKIVCYGSGDLSTGHNMLRAVQVIEAYDPEKNYNDINEIIELYNIQKLLKQGRLSEWTEEKYNYYIRKADRITGTCARFFAGITDANIKDVYSAVMFGYTDDFWILFSEYATYKRISAEAFSDLIAHNESELGCILKNKKLVQNYGKALAEFMRTSEYAFYILCEHFLIAGSESHYYIPSELKPGEYEAIFQRAIDGDPGKINTNYLNLISKASSTKECPISDKLRLAAKRGYEKYWNDKDIEKTGFQYGVSVSFNPSDEIVQSKEEKPLMYHFNFDIKWIEENLDFPTLLNNFIYLFGFFDKYNRSTFPGVKSQVSALESMIGLTGRKEYRVDTAFRMKSMMYTAFMDTYYQVLREKGIKLEDVFEWFFATYIKDEFGILNFVYNSPTENSSQIEKCRTIASEMDGVLKQFRMIYEDGEIDRELLEMSSSHITFSALRSFIPEKYAYCNSSDLTAEMFNLFSDQSMLSYTKRTEEKYDSLFDLLMHEEVEESDFPEFCFDTLEWLKNRKAILINADGFLKLNEERIAVLKDLYDHDVICPYYYENLKPIADELKDAGELRYASTLFSEPEQEYLNFMLNKSQFSNGLELRNKYAHSTYPISTKEQHVDYICFLKVMVLIIGKINEEFRIYFFQNYPLS